MNELKRPAWMPLTKGFIAGLPAVLVKYLTSLSCLMIYSQETIVSNIPNFAVCIVVFIASLFIYNSIFTLLFSFDRVSCDEYFMTADEFTGKRAEFKKLFYHRSYLMTAIPIIVVLSFSALLGASWEIAGMFHLGEGKSQFSSGIIPFLANLVISSLFVMYERYEAVRYWKVLKRQGNLEELSSKLKIIFRILFIAIAYPIMLPYLPVLAFVFISFVGMLTVLITAPALGAIVLGIIASILLIRIFLTFRRRKKSLKAIKTIIREHGYEMQNPYASLFSRRKKCTFHIQNKKSSFDVLIIGHIIRSTPICFTSETDGYYRYRIGTKRHNITMQKHFDYSIEGDGKKIMIINPTPKYAYLVDTASDKEKRVYNADLVWNFVAYEAEAFIGALDRDCLGRHTSTPERADVSVPTKLPIRYGMNRFN